MIHIACCFDKNLEASFAVLADSIESHTESEVTIHAIHDGPVDYAKSTVQTTARRTVRFYDASRRFNSYRTHGPQTPVTFARLHLPEFLDGVTKVIYLDVDMIARRDLAELSSIDLHGAPLAAVLDYPLLLQAHRKEIIGGPELRWRADRYFRDYLGMKCSGRYFNAGLLVIDVPEFARSEVRERADAFLLEKAYRCTFNEQDAMNVALDGNLKVLDPRWNFIPLLILYARHGRVSPDIEAVLRLCNDPWIVHFAGLKPWKSTVLTGPWNGEFWKGLFDVKPFDAEVVSGLLNGIMQETDRAHSSHEALLRSPARLARAWWRAVRWKLGVRRHP